MAGGRGSPAPGSMSSLPKPKPVEPLNLSSLPKAAEPQKNTATDDHLEKANNLLEELSREEKSGFNLKDNSAQK